MSKTKVGLYIDEANIRSNGGYGMQYDVLREFACHDSAEPVRLNVYATYDPKRASEDQLYQVKTNRFFAMLRNMGYKVIIKNYKWYTDEDGKAYAKANSDLDMAVDALLQSEKLDRVLLCTGDGDFVQVVRALQNKGCRVEVLAFKNFSADLLREADIFFSGYLIPNLLPMRSPFVGAPVKPWSNEDGARVRGVCYAYKQDKGYGFIRVLMKMENMWITNTRSELSPYSAVFLPASELPHGIYETDLPNHDLILEFDVVRKENGTGEWKLQARNVRRAGDLG